MPFPVSDAAIAGVVLVGVFAALLAGCGAAPPRSAGDWEAAVDTVGDTIVVRTVSGSVWGDTARLVEEVRIGGLEAGEGYLLGNPQALAVSGGGVLYVLDPQVPVVRSYDSAGTYLGDIGRAGEGPGEYRAPDGLAILPGGRLLVRDPRNMRINVYAPDGASAGSWPHPNRGDLHAYRRFYVDTTGTSWVTALRGMAPPWEWEFILIGISPDGGVTDTVAAPTFAFTPAQLKATGEHGGMSVRRVPFTPEAVWDFSPLGYMVGGVTGTYAITLFRTAQPVLRVERDREPVPVRSEEGSERRERITRDLQRQYGAWRWNGPDVPATKPPWRDLFVDDDGRIWVIPSMPGREVISAADARSMEARTGEPVLRFAEPPAFDVFADDGRFLGAVAPPAGLRTEPHPLVRGDRMWAVVEDAVGAPVVIRYRIVHDKQGAPRGEVL